MALKKYLNKNVAIELKNGSKYFGKIIEVDDSKDYIIWITILKNNTHVKFSDYDYTPHNVENFISNIECLSVDNKYIIALHNVDITSKMLPYLIKYYRKQFYKFASHSDDLFITNIATKKYKLSKNYTWIVFTVLTIIIFVLIIISAVYTI